MEIKFKRPTLLKKLTLKESRKMKYNLKGDMAPKKSVFVLSRKQYSMFV